jgi:hypothetical protein
MTISRMQQPRQMYGLGSLVKKAVKGVTGAVKSFAKSDLGKAAILGIGAFGLPTAAGQSIFGGFLSPTSPLRNVATNVLFGKERGVFPGERTGGIFNIAKNFLGGEKTFGKTATMFGLGGLGAAALQAAGLDTENPNEMPRDVESLKGYLRSGYLKLNPGAKPEDVDAFVEANTREYAANGGRIGYNEGTDFQKWLEGKQKFEQGQNAEQLYREYLEDKRRQKVAEQKTMAANGGRIGYNTGSEGPDDLYSRSYKRVMELMDEGYDFGSAVKKYMEEEKQGRVNEAYGGRIGYAFGDVVDQASGIIGLPQRVNQAGVKELDLRDSGGFIPPVGVKEKADDIPAMLSNNEFVFTADAVRNMGDGNVNKGAQRMYDMMKYLEKGGRV